MTRVTGMADKRLLAGVDVGGTKIAAGLADGEGSPIASRRVPITTEGGTAVIDQIADLVASLIRDAVSEGERIAALGVAVPAVIDDPAGAVIWAPNIPGWQAPLPVAPPLSRALRIPTFLCYDGQAWIAGESWFGAARGARNAALLAVGTGIGGGLVLDGTIHQGNVGIAGAIGWWDFGTAEGAGNAKHGRLESIASGPAIAAAASRDTAEEALQAAREGDARAQAAVREAARMLGLACANLASLLDLEIILLAGGVISGGTDLLLPSIRETVARVAQPQIAQAVQVLPAALGEDAPWLGAAALARTRISKQS